MTIEDLKEEIWKRYGSFELSHDKNEAIVNNIFEFILKERKEFAKKHVKLALKAALKNAKINVIPIDEEQWEIIPNIITSTDIENNEGIMLEINKNSILNSYDLNNII